MMSEIQIPSLHHNIQIKFSSTLTWRLGETLYEGIYGRSYSGLEIDRHIDSIPNGYCIRMTVRNTSSDVLYIQSMELLRIAQEDDLAFGDDSWDSLQIYTHGRYKNDVPAVVQLDSAERAQMGRMREDGSGMEAGSASKIVQSDTMTLLHTDHHNLLLAYPQGDRLFCHTTVKPIGGTPVLSSGCAPGVELLPGQSLESEPLWIQSGEDWRELILHWANAKAAYFGLTDSRRPTPSVFCTWYYYGLTVTQQDVEENIRQIQEKKIPYDVFQIDEGWEVTLGEWQPNHRFQKSMKELADEISQAGMIPGIWTSPFIAHETASIWTEHPEWKLLDHDGNPILFPMNGTVYHIFDLTAPGYVDWIRKFYRKLTYEWGYRYHKLDFTRAPVLHEDAPRQDMTTPLPTAYRRAIQAVREGIGDESYLLICGGLYDPIIGLTDAQRTGSDVLAIWPLSTPVQQNLLRWYMERWWDNDADCLILRRQEEATRNLNLTLGRLSDHEIRITLANQYLSGGLLSQTEPLAAVDDDRLWQIKHLLPLVPVQATPRLFADETLPSRIEVRGGDGGLCQVAFLNWDDHKPLRPTLCPSEVFGQTAGQQPSDADTRYLSVEFYGGKYYVTSASETLRLSEIPTHSADFLRIHAYDPTKPYVVGSDAHYSLGEEIRELSCRDGILTVAGEYLFPVASTYTILLPEGFCSQDGSRTVAVRLAQPGAYRFEIPVSREA